MKHILSLSLFSQGNNLDPRSVSNFQTGRMISDQQRNNQESGTPLHAHKHTQRWHTRSWAVSPVEAGRVGSGMGGKVRSGWRDLNRKVIEPWVEYSWVESTSYIPGSQVQWCVVLPCKLRLSSPWSNKDLKISKGRERWWFLIYSISPRLPGKNQMRIWGIIWQNEYELKANKSKNKVVI